VPEGLIVNVVLGDKVTVAVLLAVPVCVPDTLLLLEGESDGGTYVADADKDGDELLLPVAVPVWVDVLVDVGVLVGVAVILEVSDPVCEAVMLALLVGVSSGVDADVTDALTLDVREDV
jgi:hypothetical protein